MIRTLLSIAAVIVFILVIGALRVGWRHRAERQSGLAALPLLPDELGGARAPAVSGLYVGTTYATSWQDRVVHAGLGRRAESTLTLHERGLLLERVGDDPVFIPTADLIGARLEPALAGKVVGVGGLLVIRWRLGDTELDTGLRADDKSQYPAVVNAVNDLSRSSL
jgi:hypothetical protein